MSLTVRETVAWSLKSCPGALISLTFSTDSASLVIYFENLIVRGDCPAEDKQTS